MCLQGSPGLPGRNGVNGHNGLQAETDEMVLKVRRAWLVRSDLVVLREKQDQAAETLDAGSGSSARGRLTIIAILA